MNRKGKNEVLFGIFLCGSISIIRLWLENLNLVSLLFKWLFDFVMAGGCPCKGWLMQVLYIMMVAHAYYVRTQLYTHNFTLRYLFYRGHRFNTHARKEEGGKPMRTLHIKSATSPVQNAYKGEEGGGG